MVYSAFLAKDRMGCNTKRCIVTSWSRTEKGCNTIQYNCTDAPLVELLPEKAGVLNVFTVYEQRHLIGPQDLHVRRIKMIA